MADRTGSGAGFGLAARAAAAGQALIDSAGQAVGLPARAAAAGTALVTTASAVDNLDLLL